MDRGPGLSGSLPGAGCHSLAPPSPSLADRHTPRRGTHAARVFVDRAAATAAAVVYAFGGGDCRGSDGRCGGAAVGPRHPRAHGHRRRRRRDGWRHASAPPASVAAPAAEHARCGAPRRCAGVARPARAPVLLWPPRVFAPRRPGRYRAAPSGTVCARLYPLRRRPRWHRPAAPLRARCLRSSACLPSPPRLRLVGRARRPASATGVTMSENPVAAADAGLGAVYSGTTPLSAGGGGPPASAGAPSGGGVAAGPAGDGGGSAAGGGAVAVEAPGVGAAA